jgi:hypothetical protein
MEMLGLGSLDVLEVVGENVFVELTELSQLVLLVFS